MAESQSKKRPKVAVVSTAEIPPADRHTANRKGGAVVTGGAKVHTEADIRGRWLEAEADAARRIAKAREQPEFSVKFPGNRCTAVTFVSDQHIAPGTPVDFQRMREDAELIAATPDLYAVLAGDGVDNHIVIMQAMLAARSQPGDQYRLYDHYLQMLRDSLLVVLAGNHDLWTNSRAGIDMVEWICRERKLHYAPHDAYLAVKAGKQDYVIAARHQFRMNSSFNQTHAVKQWLKHVAIREVDIGCIGHHHESAVEAFLWRGKLHYACRPGAYQITSSYSAQYGYSSSLPTCPTFVLYPDFRRIVPFSDVRDAIVYLKAVNG